ILVIGFIVAGAVGAANATGNHEDVCVPQDAVEAVPAVYEDRVVTEAGWQRYSYTGVWESNTEAPPFPSNDWQANVAGDPHGVGVAGPYFRSNGNSGNGDWLYLEAVAEVTKQVLVTPAVEAQDAVVCEPEPVDVCLNIDGIQESIPEGMEAGPANEYGPTCVEADKANPIEEEVVDKPVSEKPEVLASTGDESWIYATIAGGLMLLGFGTKLIARRLGA